MYRFRIGEIEVEVETFEEARAMTALLAEKFSRAIDKIEQVKAQKSTTGVGPARSWKEAEELAKKLGISKNEARSRLAMERRRAVAAALEKVNPEEAPSDAPDRSDESDELQPDRLHTSRRGRPKKQG